MKTAIICICLILIGSRWLIRGLLFLSINNIQLDYIIFGSLLIIIGAGILIYNKITKKINQDNYPYK